MPADVLLEDEQVSTVEAASMQLIDNTMYTEHRTSHRLAIKKRRHFGALSEALARAGLLQPCNRLEPHAGHIARRSGRRTRHRHER
jgi:hypothetical protein